MIELNCSYEESKKILELGYDFSKVCAVFSAKGQTMSHGLPFATMIINPFLKEVGYLENLSHLKSLPYLLVGKEIDIDSITPIIPKAALEACLPRTLNFQNHLGDLSLSSFAKRFSCEVIDLYSVMEIGVTHHWFTSALEAFLWCHEHYPAELKKKFDEVMA
jgi:hypothetical protein